MDTSHHWSSNHLLPMGRPVPTPLKQTLCLWVVSIFRRKSHWIVVQSSSWTEHTTSMKSEVTPNQKHHGFPRWEAKHLIGGCFFDSLCLFTNVKKAHETKDSHDVMAERGSLSTAKHENQFSSKSKDRHYFGKKNAGQFCIYYIYYN